MYYVYMHPFLLCINIQYLYLILFQLLKMILDSLT